MTVRPGNYSDYRSLFRSLSLLDLLRRYDSLPRSGCGHPNANYYKALTLTLTERGF